MRMRQRGIATLKVEPGNTVRDFLGNFPEQKSEVLAVAGGKYQKHRLMPDVFRGCGQPLQRKRKAQRHREMVTGRDRTA